MRISSMGGCSSCRELGWIIPILHCVQPSCLTPILAKVLYQDTHFSVSRPNLFMRWAQFGCFSPLMQMHRQVAQELQYPWRYGDEALNNFRFFAQLHTRLFPYIYTYARQASTTGLPII